MLKLVSIGQTSTASIPSKLMLSLLAVASLIALTGCNDNGSPQAAAPAPVAAPVPAAESAQPVQTAYAPPSADVLYQMVAPIALYPDKLVAQVLAGATYPDQVSAAEVWLGQNPGLQKTALVSAVNTQSWDPSVKSLIEFPNVLAQLAGNIPWTTALGKAYYNDPSDVLNAIQVMRGRAVKAGSLKTSQQLKVQVAAKPVSTAYTASDAETPLYSNPVIAPPEQFIQIEPTQVATVYVPQYDPAVVYGTPVPLYHSYRTVIAPPPPPAVVVGSAPVVAGIIGFGAGVVLATAVESHPGWGWHSWDMHWGDHDHDWRPGNPPPPPQARPAVVYNNRTYISQSTTVVENIHNYVHTTQITNNTVAPGAANPVMNAGAPAPTSTPAMPQGGGAHGFATTAAVGAVGAAVAGGAAMALATHHGNASPAAAMAPRQAPLQRVPTMMPAHPAPVAPQAVAAPMPRGADVRHGIAAMAPIAPATPAAPSNQTPHAKLPVNAQLPPHAPVTAPAQQHTQAMQASTAAQQQHADAQRRQAMAQARAQDQQRQQQAQEQLHQQQALAEQQNRQRQQQEAAQQEAQRAQQALQEQQRAQQQAQQHQAEQRMAAQQHPAAVPPHAPTTVAHAAPRPAPAPHAVHPPAHERKHER